MPEGKAILLQRAMALHLEERHAESEALYRKTISEYPDSPEPRHYLGFLLMQQGKLEESLEFLSESLRLDDSKAEWHYNHGILLSRLDRKEEAIESFLNSLKLDSANYFGWTNLGSLFEEAGEPDQAEKAYLAASRIDPECPDAYYLLSSLLASQERFEEAKYFNCKGFIKDPAKDKPRIRLAVAHFEIGMKSDAIAIMENWLADDPENPVPSHMLTAFRGNDVPERCSDRYLEATFDHFAASFDSHLEKLKYRGPELLEKELLLLDRHRMEILDMGCGTGLNGMILKPFSASLTGVDISAAMLEKARERNCYDLLVKSEMGQFLQKEKDRFDLVACMDTLIYFGNLEPVLKGVFSSLRASGIFIFTTEKCESGTEYDLDISGRYRHSQSYLSGLIEAIGFETASSRDAVIRYESGRPVMGQICRVLKKGSIDVQSVP